MRASSGPQATGLLAALVLLFSLAASTSAEPEYAWPDISWEDLKPYRDFKSKHEFYYQVPNDPRGVVFLAHGCVHSAYNYWPQSKACPECRGLPEELSHTLQALKLGYAVIAISSLDRETGCWSFWNDCFDVWDILSDWRADWGLDHLPLYGAGISSGGSFVMKLPRYMKFDGVLSEALGIDPLAGGITEVKGEYPPTVIISMVKDTKQKEVIDDNKRELEARGTPVEIIKAYPRQVYPTYFSERFPLYISEGLSIKIHDGLLEIGMIDEEGNILEDPRYTDRPWLKELQEVVPQLRKGTTEEFQGRTVPTFPEMSDDTRLPGVYELMNLAWCLHEIISDYFSVSLKWFESNGRADIQSLQDQYTVGWPPAPSPPPPPPRPCPPSPRPPSPPPPLPPTPLPAPAPAEVMTNSISASTEAMGTPSSDDSAAIPSSTGAASSSDSYSSSNMVAIIAGATGGAVAAILLVALLWWCVWQRRAARDRGTSNMTSSMQAVHMAPAGVTAQVSLGAMAIQERFQLTEVVEQTGSPSSARRRMRTAFQGSPRKSPRKHGSI